MLSALVVLLLIVPVAELWVIVQVAQGIGVLETFVLLVAVSIAGAWLLKQQGIATWQRLKRSIARGDVPTDEATDGALILLGGALLLTPGFITDVAGLLLVAPATRAVIKRIARRLFARWAKGKLGLETRWSPAEHRVVRVERVSRVGPRSSRDPLDEGGSRDSS